MRKREVNGRAKEIDTYDYCALNKFRNELSVVLTNHCEVGVDLISMFLSNTNCTFRQTPVLVQQFIVD